MIQLNPRFASAKTVGQLVSAGVLAKGMDAVFRNTSASSEAADRSMRLHQHQEDAIGLAKDGKSFVVTTGTGSGKSMCYFLPIVDRVLRSRRNGEPQFGACGGRKSCARIPSFGLFAELDGVA